MKQTQEVRKKLKEEELAQDRKMLDSLRTSPPNRHIHKLYGGMSPPPPPGAPMHNMGLTLGTTTGGWGDQASLTARPSAMAALEGSRGSATGAYRDTGEGPHHVHLQENESAAGNRCESRFCF
jgi:hypothetical protein